MGEILGIGTTHSPPGLVPAEHKPWPLARMLHTDPRIPAAMRDPANWPEPMRAEWGSDEGIASFEEHRARVFKGFRTLRDEIAAFRPDLIVIWGDDQYENFREDVIPPFCVLAYDTLTFQPFAARDAAEHLGGARGQGVHVAGTAGRRPLPRDAAARVGHRHGLRVPALARRRRGARVRQHPPLPRPRSPGFPLSHPAGDGELLWPRGDPQPRWREPVRDRGGPARAVDYAAWRDLSLETMEASGQHEILNWVCLAGAMAELDATMQLVDWVETWIFNAPKCQAIFR